jgi:MFS family permease
MSTDKYLNELSEIKDLMNRSSKFLSLSGLSGILAGIYALLGAILAFYILQNKTVYIRMYSSDNVQLVIELFGIALTVAFFAILTAYLLSRKKAIKSGERIWNETTKLLLIHFLIPLITGGIFGLILLFHEHYGIIAPITLIFYGLALVNASKFTLDTVKYLGISEIIVGLIAAYFVGYGIYFWGFGFGILHIIYGSVMYYRELLNKH